MILEIKVKTNSKKQELFKISDNKYLVYLKSLPQDNKANIELLKLLNKHFTGDIKLIRGKTSKNKKVKIENGN